MDMVKLLKNLEVHTDKTAREYRAVGKSMKATIDNIVDDTLTVPVPKVQVPQVPTEPVK
jgi:hypothetical protein